MYASSRERITGLVILAFSVLWIVAVWQTIPAGTPGTVGPRAFPLVLGGALALMACILIGRTFRPVQHSADSDMNSDENAGPAADGYVNLWMVAALFITVVVYGFAMEKIGFVLSTLLVVPAVMILILRIRSWQRIVGMAVGLAFGCWLVFGKILGAYIPPGIWISLF